ncbi:MAG: DUF992 domain-containing protein [Bradyrhizobium sp.]|nr:DUF992 domain-containing protein [Bradyrhizobium sp.]
MSRVYLPFFIAALAASFVTSASAQTRPVWVGNLICDADPRLGLVLGSRQDMRCVFHSSDGAAQYAYHGKIRRIGIDFGVTRAQTLTWSVFAPASPVGRGALRGNYLGASGNAALGVGVGAKVLVGGSRHRISLQPLTIGGQIGINLAVAVSSLTLR